MRSDANRELFYSLDPCRFADRYVVIAGGQLIGSGKSLGTLLKKADRLHPGKIPFIGRPRDPRKVYVYAAGT